VRSYYFGGAEIERALFTRYHGAKERAEELTASFLPASVTAAELNIGEVKGEIDGDIFFRAFLNLS